MSGRSDVITLSHGGGGKLTHDLIRQVFARRLSNPLLEAFGDSALLSVGTGRIAFTTDSFVVSPRFFPGGDMGRLAVCGTVNDLAVAGAIPRFLSCAVILEEGMPWAELESLVDSLAATAREAGVLVVTGDTKVVEKGKGDGVFFNTAGVGILRETAPQGLSQVKPGDVILVNGTLGDHGAVIVSVRSGIELDSPLLSDCAPLNHLIDAVYQAGISPKFMRDPTRGGAAGVLAELARDAHVGLELQEEALPVREEVVGICELLGLEPLYLANEGKVLLVVAPEDADGCLKAMRAHPLGREATRLGEVVETHPGRVILRTRYGGQRIVDQPTAEPLPRIC